MTATLAPAPATTETAWDPRAVALGGFAVALAVAVSPGGFAFTWTPKLALLLVVLGPGMVVLAVRALAGDRTAGFAAALVAIAAIATLLADRPVLALFGGFGGGNGLVVLAASVGLWALARDLRPGAARAVRDGLLAAAALNALVAWVQLPVDLGVALRPYQGSRAAGLSGNPVHLGALCAAGLVLVAEPALAKRRPLLAAALTVLLVGAVQLSGSRIAVVAGLLGLVWVGRRLPRRSIVVGAGAVLVGLGLATLVASRTAGATSTQRATTATGVRSRIDIWEGGLRALGARPVLGWGPGRGATAALPRYPRALSARRGGDPVYADLHDALLEVAAGTGLLGLAALAAWLALAAREARGPLATFAVVIGVCSLLQPLFVGVTPLALLALGAAAPAGPIGRRPRAVRTLTVALAVVGLLGGATLVGGDLAMARASKSDDLGAARRAVAVLPAWPEAKVVESRALAARSSAEPRLRSEAIAAARAAVRRDPDTPVWWWQLGDLQAAWGHPAAADRSYRAALARNPWSIEALLGRLGLAEQGHDAATVGATKARLCTLVADGAVLPPYANVDCRSTP